MRTVLFPAAVVATAALACAVIANGLFAGPSRYLAWRGVPVDMSGVAINRLADGEAPLLATQPLIAPHAPSSPTPEAQPPKVSGGEKPPVHTPPPSKTPEKDKGTGKKPVVALTDTPKATPGEKNAQSVPDKKPSTPAPQMVQDNAIREITSQEAFSAFKAGAPFLDGRRSKEYESGHIQGAHCVPIWESDIDARLIQFEAAANADPKDPLVIYCSSQDCEDSHLLAAKLRRLGYRNLCLYKGGYPDWEAQGRPIRKGAQP